VNEVVLAIHEATEKGGSFDVTSRFEPPAPMHWVR
jgi:hypothetical protein